MHGHLSFLQVVSLLAFAVAPLHAQFPDNLHAQDVPAIPDELRRDTLRYLEFRKADFLGWRPAHNEILVTTRFADTAQLHAVKMPGGARQQLTFGTEPVTRAEWQPKLGKFLLFGQDSGGGEFYQLLRLDPDGRVTLMTDGKSRNTGLEWAPSGSQFAFTSTRRNGKDNDIFVQLPDAADSARCVLEVTGGGWSVLDWSDDESRLLIGEYLSANESKLHILDLKSGKAQQISPSDDQKVVWSDAEFAPGGSVIAATDRGSEFRQLVRIDPASKTVKPVLKTLLKWDVDEFKLSPDGSIVALTINEEGSSTLLFADLRSGAILHEWQKLHVLSHLRWNEDGSQLGFTAESASSPADAWSGSVKRSGDHLEFAPRRWTFSETGGLDPASFPIPEVVRVDSFDGLKMSGFLYRPDSKKFPGKRPCIISIHGGPESQSQPDFIGRWNYFVAELGVAMCFPNVRGSAGFGKTFIALDNGFHREDSVRDIGAFITRLKQDAAIDGDRLAVVGGSYGGYMVLASLIHHSSNLRCGVDIVGISNFLTFLQNTQDYRRDLRRVEYGDERDPKMAEFLAKIAPTARASDIKDPLFIVQGKNDPRVPVTEARQMAEAVRKASGTVWYLEADDEGHGFAKKKNADFLFLSMIQFFRKYLLN